MNATQLVGLPVFTIKKGKRISEVNDVIYDPLGNKVEGLLLDEGGLFTDSKIIPFNEIKGMGEDAVLIDDEDAIKNGSDLKDNVSSIAKNGTELTGTKIITENGIDLGTVTDIYFDLQTGNVEELEVSQGALKNIQSGKKRVKTSDIVTIGEDATIVKGYIEEKFHEQAKKQGIQGALTRSRGMIEEGVGKAQKQTKKMTKKGQSKYGEVEDKMQEKLEEAEGKAGEIQENLQETVGRNGQVGDIVMNQVSRARDAAKSKINEVRSRMIEKRKEDVVGMYLTKAILTPDDEIIAEKGDMVTHKLLQKAETYGLLDQVLNNVTYSPQVAQM